MTRNNLTTGRFGLLILMAMAALPGQAAQFIVQSNLDLPPDGNALETMPGVFTVQTLRSAIALANDENNFPGPDQITFDFTGSGVGLTHMVSGGTNDIVIGLTGDQFNFQNQSSSSAFGINSSITIDGALSGTARVSLSATGLRHFQVNPGGWLRLYNLNLKDGETPLNSAGLGGAVVVLDGAKLEVDLCSFSDNQAVNGGAIALQNGALASQISRTLFLFNSASDEIAQTENGAGGALFATNSVFPLFLEGNLFSHNDADANGGAVYLSGVAELARSEVRNNTADLSGGAVFIDAAGSVTITNSLIYDNRADAFGGGAAISDGGQAQIISTTITENNSGDLTSPIFRGPVNEQGGGVFVAATGDLELHNTIISDNFNGGEQVDVTGGVDAQSSHNLIGVDLSLQNISHGINGNLIGTTGQPIDARIEFDQLLRVAGLASNSPALDAGSNLQVTAHNLTTDFRGSGYPRIQGMTTDIGAYEMDYIFTNGFEALE
jgi:hypothetical protein